MFLCQYCNKELKSVCGKSTHEVFCRKNPVHKTVKGHPHTIDHNVDIRRNSEKRQYIWEGKTKNYIPDFIVDGKIIEIKGFKTKEWLAKLDANPDVEVLYEKDMKPYIDYVIGKYGKDYIKLYK